MVGKPTATSIAEWNGELYGYNLDMIILYTVVHTLSGPVYSFSTVDFRMTR